MVATNDSGDTEQHADEQVVEKYGFRPLMGALLIALWAALLLGTTVAARAISYKKSPPLHWFELFYRTGSLIFGGGQVVLPLLLGEMVHEDCSDPSKGCVPLASSWMSKEEFYTGLAAAQAMPGPLFNFAAYLGMLALHNGPPDQPPPPLPRRDCGTAHWVQLVCGRGAVLAGVVWSGHPVDLWCASILEQVSTLAAVPQVRGCYSMWLHLRTYAQYRALPGLNSAAVGLIASAVIGMVFSVTGSSSPFPKASVCIGALYTEACFVFL